MPKKPGGKIKAVKAWAGFVDDEMDSGWADGLGNQRDIFSLFKTRAEARIYFSDVRPVGITPLPRKRRKK